MGVRSKRVVAGGRLGPVAAAVLLVGACDSLEGVTLDDADAGAGAEASTTDGAVDAATTADGGTIARCAASVPFRQTRPLASLNIFDNATPPHLSPDELTIYFGAQAHAGDAFLLYAAARSDLDAGFDTPEALAVPPNGSGATPIDNALDPAVSEDGLRLYFSSFRNNVGYGEIFVSTRSNIAASFGDASAVFPRDNNYRLEPGLGPSDVLWYAIEALDGGAVLSSTLWISQLDGGSPHPIDLPGVTPFALGPVPSHDGAVLYFAGCSGGICPSVQIYRAIRDPDGGYGQIAPVSELAFPGAGPSGVRPGYVSQDGCRLYFSSDGQSRTGHVDVFVAEK